jgi:uncharacterized membrane protein
MFVALFPFTTSLVNEFPEKDAAEIIFGMNMLIVSVLFLFNWIYATHKRHLVDGAISDENITIGRNKCLFFIFVAAAAIALSQVHPSISADIYWIIPLLVFFEHIAHRSRKHSA